MAEIDSDHDADANADDMAVCDIHHHEHTPHYHHDYHDRAHSFCLYSESDRRWHSKLRAGCGCWRKYYHQPPSSQCDPNSGARHDAEITEVEVAFILVERHELCATVLNHY